MPYPVIEASADLGDALLAVSSYLFALLSALAAGGAVLVLACHRRGMGSMDPRWEALARRAAAVVLGSCVTLLALVGVAVGMAAVLFRPRAAEHLLALFRLPLTAGWALALAALGLLVFYVAAWPRGRERRPLHFPAGVAAAGFLWLAAAVPVAIRAFTLTGPAAGAAGGPPFGPAALPAFLLWGAMGVAAAGAGGLLYAVCQRDAAWRASLVEEVGAWTLGGAAAAALAGGWWALALPGAPRPGGNWPALLGAVVVLGHAGLGGFVFLTALRRPARFGPLLASIVLLAVLGLTAAVERARTQARGPYLIHRYMFRNGILVSELERLGREGLWRASRDEGENGAPRPEELGTFSFRVQCAACHPGWRGEGPAAAPPPFRREGEALRFLEEIGTRHPALPVFAGTAEERRAVAAHLEGLLRSAGLTLEPPPEAPVPAREEAPKKAPPPAPAVREAPPSPEKEEAPAPKEEAPPERARLEKEPPPGEGAAPPPEPAPASAPPPATEGPGAPAPPAEGEARAPARSPAPEAGGTGPLASPPEAAPAQAPESSSGEKAQAPAEATPPPREGSAAAPQAEAEAPPVADGGAPPAAPPPAEKEAPAAGGEARR